MLRTHQRMSSKCYFSTTQRIINYYSLKVGKYDFHTILDDHLGEDNRHAY